MLRLAICDDEESMVQTLRGLVERILGENHELAEIAEYTQSSMLLYDIQDGRHFDLILSDIDMPHLDGMKLVDQIHLFLPEVLIIFITSYVQYSIDAFELSVFRFIPKNELEKRLPSALIDAIHMAHLQTEKSYTICTPSQLRKIPYRKIIYIVKDGKNAVFSLTNRTQVKERKSLAAVYSALGTEDFVFIDRGMIVNLSHIMTLHDDAVEMDDGTRLYPSRLRMDQLKSELQAFWKAHL